MFKDSFSWMWIILHLHCKIFHYISWKGHARSDSSAVALEKKKKKNASYISVVVIDETQRPAGWCIELVQSDWSNLEYANQIEAIWNTMSHELDVRIRYCFSTTSALETFIILFRFKQIVLIRLLRLARFCWPDFALSHVNLKTYCCCSLIEISRNVVNSARTMTPFTWAVPHLFSSLYLHSGYGTHWKTKVGGNFST